MEEMKVPPWLESLLSSAFFTICPRHRDTPRNECNMYCLDCMNDAFCFYCRSSRHKDHLVIQIRRSSYHDVVRVAEIQKVLDISGVQTYVINSARVLFLNERPLPKSSSSSSKGVSHLCEICSRSLLDPFRFCSLGCKLVGTRNNGDTSFLLSNKDEEEVTIRRREGIAPNRLPSKEEEELREGSPQEMYRGTPNPAHSNSRRRKGIPHRAPLGS
ncbi:hypothetical protein QUC31_018843 [Theobroma cacao]|uniref:PLATZ transcription factor family protein isoform 1 n=2 Tax=Theobroma cacao TaxID=3641 RepID=A0A061GZU7_THECC|nr:PLATZ transcription factor family protein isoform 1 [Theobroma cacao]